MCARPRLSDRNLDIASIFWFIRTNKRNTPVTRSLRKLAREKLLTEYPSLTEQDRHEIMVVWSRSDCHLYKSPSLAKISHANQYGIKCPKGLYRHKFDKNGNNLTIVKLDDRQLKLDLDFRASKMAKQQIREVREQNDWEQARARI